MIRRAWERAVDWVWRRPVLFLLLMFSAVVLLTMCGL